MRARVRQRRRDAGTIGEDLRPAFELSWRRQPYRVLAQAEAGEGRRWLARLPERRVPFFDPQPPSPPWTFVGRETPVRGSTVYGQESAWPPSAAETINVYRLGWPPGGIFIPATPGVGEDYDPLAVAADILLDVQRAAATETTDSLVHFVNRWGLLGVGIPGAEAFPTDGVLRTGEGLRELARWMAVIHALQGHKPATETWADIASVFRERLAGVHVQARVTPRSGLVACFRVPRLIDALYLELWNVATGGKRLRRCKRCEDFFVRGREDQVFCTGRCARLWHVKRWKQQQRRKRHQARHSPQQRG
jgi:hypothetical protein